VVAVVAAVIGLAISVVLMYSTALLAIGSARYATVSIQPSATPLVWPQLILPVGYALLCLAYLDEIARRVLGVGPRVYDDEIGDTIE
jgi:TRAP-type C4-dicarboxylate transport system permease small subunit